MENKTNLDKYYNYVRLWKEQKNKKQDFCTKCKKWKLVNNKICFDCYRKKYIHIKSNKNNNSTRKTMSFIILAIVGIIFCITLPVLLINNSNSTPKSNHSVSWNASSDEELFKKRYKEAIVELESYSNNIDNNDLNQKNVEDFLKRKLPGKQWNKYLKNLSIKVENNENNDKPSKIYVNFNGKSQTLQVKSMTNKIKDLIKDISKSSGKLILSHQVHSRRITPIVINDAVISKYHLNKTLFNQINSWKLKGAKIRFLLFIEEGLESDGIQSAKIIVDSPNLHGGLWKKYGIKKIFDFNIQFSGMDDFYNKTSKTIFLESTNNPANTKSNNLKNWFDMNDEIIASRLSMKFNDIETDALMIGRGLKEGEKLDIKVLSDDGDIEKKYIKEQNIQSLVIDNANLISDNHFKNIENYTKVVNENNKIEINKSDYSWKIYFEKTKNNTYNVLIKFSKNNFQKDFKKVFKINIKKVT